MAQWTKVCSLATLPEGACKTVECGTKVVAVFHNNGALNAIDDFCPHMGASLSGGHVEDGCVTCPWHAWRFRLTDGAWADNPRIRIGSYPTRVVDGVVEVEVE